MATQAERMMVLLAGCRSAYGLYRIEKGQHRADGKVEGKGHTLRKPVTVELWAKHLEGIQGFGVIPIREDDTCSWGAIDVDDYSIKLKELARRIKDLPLVLCRTKSGGAHLYLFISEPIAAGLMQLKLREVAANLGFGECEIFPKQTHILAERGDFGNWLNMPYFNAEQTDRYAFSDKGNPLTLLAFLKLAEAKTITVEALEQWTLEAQVGEAFADGPPCLQVLAGRKVQRGNRNNALLNVGIYCKLRYPENWEEELEKANVHYFQPPLKASEVTDVLKHLRKKDYVYTCKSPPIVSHCNSALCKTRPYGVGDSGPGIVISSLSKLDTQPPLWFADIPERGRLELTTDQLNSGALFVKSCMEQLNFRPVLSAKTWPSLLNSLFENLTIIEMTEEEKLESSTGGAFEELLTEFTSGRFQATRLEEILLRKAFTDKGRTIFRLPDLIAFLERKGFRDYTRNKITQELRQRGARMERARKIKGHFTRTWSLPALPEPGTTIPQPENMESPI